MDRVIKLNSYQAGNFTESQNLVDFYIPSGAVYNLKDSYINLNTKINVTETAGSIAEGGKGIYSAGLQWLDNTGTPVNTQFQNVSIIKNASISSATKGRIEDIRRVDILRNNLMSYTRDARTLQCDQYLRGNNGPNPIDNANLGIFRDINKEGRVLSRDLDIIPVSIRLSDIFDFCNTEEYDTSQNKGGQTRIHLELNLKRLGAIQGVDNTDAMATVMSLMGKVGKGAVGIVNFYSGYDVLELTQNAFWVGQRVLVSTTTTNGGLVVNDLPRIIVDIEWVRDTGGNTGRLLFTLDKSIGDTPSGDCIPSMLPANWDNAEVEMNYAEIVLKEVVNPEGISEISYSTYSTEQLNGNQQINFQKQFQIEAEATNCLIMFPSPYNGLLTHNPDIDNFRLRLNNEDLTDRPIDVNSPLYYDRLAMTLNNMDSGLRNARQNSEGVTGDYNNRASVDANKLVMISNPLPQMKNEKLLQVNINTDDGSSGIEEMVLYKELPRTLSY